MSSIVRECLVINLQVGVWLGYRLDKTLTKKVTDEASASPDAARVNKHLIPKHALADVMSNAGLIRNHFYDKTLPWKDNGDRLLTRKLSLTFIEEHTAKADRFKMAVDEFLTHRYRVAQQQAEFRMGELFDIADYPSEEALRHKFYVNLDIDGVAPAKDIRLDDSTELLQARITKAVGGLWQKLAEPLKHFTEVMGEEKAIFRNTTISNLREIVEMIPVLNFTEDPVLEKIRAEIEQKITSYEPDDLRKDKAARSIAAGEAGQILADMMGYMKALQPNGEDV